HLGANVHVWFLPPRRGPHKRRTATRRYGSCPRRHRRQDLRNPRDFLKPSRMIHFLDFSNEKMVAKVPDIAPTVDILLGNLEDAVPLEKKEAARAGLIRVGREMELGDTALWTRVNELASLYFLDDMTDLVTQIGD